MDSELLDALKTIETKTKALVQKVEDLNAEVISLTRNKEVALKNLKAVKDQIDELITERNSQQELIDSKNKEMKIKSISLKQREEGLDRREETVVAREGNLDQRELRIRDRERMYNLNRLK